MKKFFFDCGTRDSTASLGIFFLRLSIGAMMLLGHGLGKLQNFSNLKDHFEAPSVFPLNLMTGPMSLIATIGTEVGCAALLILGLASRPAAFALGFTMTVAAFSIHGSDPWFMGGEGGSKEPALLYLIPCVAILLTGAGQYSMDSLLYFEKRKKKW